MVFGFERLTLSVRYAVFVRNQRVIGTCIALVGFHADGPLNRTRNNCGPIGLRGKKNQPETNHRMTSPFSGERKTDQIEGNQP